MAIDFLAPIIGDDRVRLLTGDDRWHYVDLLRFKKSGMYEDEPSVWSLEITLAVQMGLTQGQLKALKKRMLAAGAIDDSWNPQPIRR